MKTYRFLGYDSEYNSVNLKRYGTKIMLPVEMAEQMITGHPPALLLPDEVFAEYGLTDEELAKYHSVLLHGQAPQEFQDKTKALRKALHDYREDLARQQSAPVEESTVAVKE